MVKKYDIKELVKGMSEDNQPDIENEERKVELFNCGCNTPEHIFYVSKYKDEPEFFFEVQLNNWLPWYKRIYYAIRYVFGGDCGWDETILEPEDTKRLIKFLKENS